MDRVRLAIVGCGNICQLNAPGYLEHPRCDVVALCDTEWARAEMRARQWGITPRIYKDYAELLDDSTVDAVELLTPTYLHAEQIVAALAAGKHVSCQKPIAVSVADADRRPLPLQGSRLPRHHRLHVRPRDAHPEPLLSRGRILRDSRLTRHPVGHPLHRRDARPAAGDADQGDRDDELPGAHGLAHG